MEKTGAKHYASYLDAPAIPGNIDVELQHGDVLEFAGKEYPVIILRGHTPGGVALAAVIDGVPNLFVGDSLFPGGLGKPIPKAISCACSTTSATGFLTNTPMKPKFGPGTVTQPLWEKSAANLQNGGNDAGK